MPSQCSHATTDNRLNFRTSPLGVEKISADDMDMVAREDADYSPKDGTQPRRARRCSRVAGRS